MKNFDCSIFVKRANELFGDKSQQEIAREVGISQTYVSSIKSGKVKSPGADTVFRIAEYFNVSADWLLGLSDCRTTDKTTKEICKTVGLSGETVDFLTAESFCNKYDTPLKIKTRSGNKITLGIQDLLWKNLRTRVQIGIDFLILQTIQNPENSILSMFASYADTVNNDLIGQDVLYTLNQSSGGIADDYFTLDMYSVNNGEIGERQSFKIPAIPGLNFWFNDCNSVRNVISNRIIDEISLTMRKQLELNQDKRENEYVKMLKINLSHILPRKNESDT